MGTVTATVAWVTEEVPPRMPDTGSGGMMPVERIDLVTQDMDMLTELVSRMYAEHQARYRRIPEVRPEASVRGAVSGVLRAGLVRITGVEYEATEEGAGAHATGLVAVEGSVDMTAGRDRHRFARGQVFMLPPDQPYWTRGRGILFTMLQVPWSVVSQVAETHTGLPAADLRFESLGPVSEAASDMWARTVMFGCRQLIDSGITEISPLMAQEMSRLTAAALLTAFPNTTLTLGYVRGPDWVPPAAVRRAAAFINAHPHQPITLDDIAAAAGVTGRALQYAFRRHYDTTPTGYLRQVRIDHAHHELAAAEPGDGTTVSAVARKWGWTSPAHFAAAYRRQHGQLPSQTLRT
jgi:AraC-like DNA-binding protein